MQMLRPAISLSLFLLVCTGTASGAPVGKLEVRDRSLEQAIAYYKGNQLEAAVPLLQAFLLRQPTSAEAHYYYGNCLAREGQRSAASFEYQASLQYSTSSEMTKYSRQALLALAQAKTETAPAISGALTSIPKLTKDKIVSHHLDQEITTVNSIAEKEHQRLIDAKKVEMNRKIARVKQDLQDEIEATPRYIGLVRSANVNYERIVENLKIQADYKIKIVISDYQEEFAKIDDAYSKRKEALGTAHENLKGQMKATVGSSQVTPSGTTFYVRNYVNFGGITEDSTVSPGLRAVPLRLKSAGAIPPPQAARAKRNLDHR